MQHRCFAIGKNRGKRMRAAIAQRRCEQFYNSYTGCCSTHNQRLAHTLARSLRLELAFRHTRFLRGVFASQRLQIRRPYVW